MISRRVLMYIDHPVDTDYVERLAATYGYIIANPRKHRDTVTLMHPDGTEFEPPEGTDIWVSEIVASEHDQARYCNRCGIPHIGTCLRDTKGHNDG